LNINDYRKALDHITPGIELKKRIMDHKTSSKKFVPVRRVFTGALAAALTLTCLFTVALAASPELRMAVLSFFRMEEQEQVPSQNGASSRPEISQVEIGDVVKVQYIKTDRHYGFSSGLLNDLTWSEDYRTLLDAKFWDVKDNVLIPMEIGLNTTNVDITFNGAQYQGEFYWFVRDGELAVLKGHPVGVDARPEDQWYISAIPGYTDVVLLWLYQGGQLEYSEYPILYHLDTGETEDFLANTGVNKLEYAYDYLWSEDMRKALISCRLGPDGQQEWLCNLDTKTLTHLEELTGFEDEVTASFADSDTLILTTHTTMEGDDIWQTVTCYAYNIPTGQMMKTLDEAHCYQWWEEEPYGVQMFGSRCVLVGQDGQVRLVDLQTGMQTVIEGFTFQKGNEFMISPSGDKLLYYASDSEAEGLGITQLGVVDLEKGTFIAFDREGYKNLYEEAIGWNDNNTVSINARALDGEIRYLILYQF